MFALPKQFGWLWIVSAVVSAALGTTGVLPVPIAGALATAASVLGFFTRSAMPVGYKLPAWVGVLGILGGAIAQGLAYPGMGDIIPANVAMWVGFLAAVLSNTAKTLLPQNPNTP